MGMVNKNTHWVITKENIWQRLLLRLLFSSITFRSVAGGVTQLSSLVLNQWYPPSLINSEERQQIQVHIKISIVNDRFQMEFPQYFQEADALRNSCLLSENFMQEENSQWL